jgi:hypothetical protein
MKGVENGIATFPSEINQVLSFFFRMIRGIGRIVRA